MEEKKPAARSGGLFAAPQRKKAAPVEEEKEEAKPVATRRAGLFAAPQRKAAPAAEEKEEAKPAATRSGGLFGTRAQRRPEPAAEPEEKKPVTRSGGLFGTRSARTAAAAAEPAKTVAGTRGTRGTSSTTTRGAAAATTTRRQASPAPVPEQPKRVVRGRKPIAAEEVRFLRVCGTSALRAGNKIVGRLTSVRLLASAEQIKLVCACCAAASSASTSNSAAAAAQPADRCTRLRGCRPRLSPHPALLGGSRLPSRLRLRSPRRSLAASCRPWALGRRPSMRMSERCRVLGSVLVCCKALSVVEGCFSGRCLSG